MRITGLMAGSALVAATLLGATGGARADTILWVDDQNGNIGQVDITHSDVVAGSVKSVTGVSNGPLTDIGFTQNGTLYGTTFDNLYSINTSGANDVATQVGSAYTGSASGMNALVGDGNALLGASGSSSTIYNITATGTVTTAAGFSSPVISAGDLAFSGSTLFESGVDTNNGNVDELVDASTGTKVADFTLSTNHSTTFQGVFGLADDGTTMYAVNNTSVYSVNTSNGVLTFLFDYSGHGLGDANGTAFLSEASNPTAPEPSTIAIFGAAIAGLGVLRGRRRKA
jgi:hypothetical protein